MPLPMSPAPMMPTVRTAAANEARGLLVARDKVKLRVKRGATSKTLEKLDFVKGVTLTQALLQRGNQHLLRPFRTRFR